MENTLRAHLSATPLSPQVLCFKFLELVSKAVPAGLGVFPQGLKPVFLLALDGVAEATPLQSIIFETSSSFRL